MRRSKNSLLGLLVFIGMAGYAAYEFFLETEAEEASVAALGTRIEIQGSEFYYSDAVTEDQAQSLTDFLEGAGFFSNQKVSVRLDRAGDTWIFQTVIIDHQIAKQYTSVAMTFFAAEIAARVFDGGALGAHLCKELRKPAVRTVSNAGMRHSLKRSGSLLVYGDVVDEEEATRIADLLEDIGFFEGGTATLHLAKEKDIWQLRSVARHGISEDNASQAALKEVAAKVSSGALGGAHVEFHLFDPRSDRWVVAGRE